MANRPKRACTHPGCSALTDGGRCADHAVERQQQYDHRRGSSSARGYDTAWRSVRAERLRLDNYLCRHCLRDGRPETATDVDHIVPIARGGARLDLGNLQSLCGPCHSRKTVTEDGGFGNARRHT